MQDIGKSITESVRFITNVGEQIESLVRLVKDELSLSMEKIKAFKTANEWTNEVRRDEYEWVVTDYAHCIALKPISKGNHGVAGYLGIQISLVGDGIDIENNEEPLLHVCWFNDPLDFEIEYFGIPIDEEAIFTVINGVIFDWNPGVEIFRDQRWSYSLRLTSINTPDDVKRKIVEPVISLFNNGIKESALLLEKLDGIVQYEQSDDQPTLVKITSK